MGNRPPKVKLNKHEPLRDQYSDGTGSYWGVAKLIDDTKDLKPFDAPLASLDLSGEIWDGYNMVGLARHCKRVADADLSKPIIIAWNGSVADGRHRIIRALIEGKRTIRAVRMLWRPGPCGSDK